MNRVRCPDCHTLFQLNEDLLKKKSGLVRCGRCLSVFNANLSLIAQTTQQKPNDIDLDKIEDKAFNHDKHQNIPSYTDCRVVENNIPSNLALQTKNHPVVGVSSDQEEPIDHTLGKTEISTLFSDKPPIKTEIEIESSVIPVDHGLVFQETFNPIESSQDNIADKWQIHSGTQQEDLQVMRYRRQQGKKVSYSLNHKLNSEETTQQDVVSSELVADTALLTPVPELIIHDEDERPQENITSTEYYQSRYFDEKPTNLKYSLGCLFLAILLILQLIFYMRASLIEKLPALQDPFDKVCQVLACSQRAPRTKNALNIENSELELKPNSSFVLHASIRNMVNHPILMPYLELSLSDEEGEPLVRKVIPPEIWIKKGNNTQQMQAQQDIEFTLPFTVSTEQPVVNYSLYAFYP